MSPTNFLLRAAEEAISSTPQPNWMTTRDKLVNVYRFGTRVVDEHKDEIRQLLSDHAKQIRSTSPNTGSLMSPAASPPLAQTTSRSSYGSSSTQDSSSANEERNPKQVFLVFEGPEESITEDLIGCEWGDEERSIIAYPALERRGLQSLIDKETYSIRLSWHKSKEQSKIYPTLFQVVSGDELPGADIRFGKNWMQRAPLELSHRAVGGKRKRSYEEQDKTNILDAVGAAIGHGLRTFIGSSDRSFSHNRLSYPMDHDDSSSTHDGYGQRSFRHHGS